MHFEKKYQKDTSKQKLLLNEITFQQLLQRIV